MTSEKFYSSTLVEGPWDTIIIGSGASALTAGAMLAKAGQRVLLLEQHYQPGGYTHRFTRKNYEWDVGLHYMGKALQTSTWYHQMAGITGGAIELEPFKEYTDELYFPDCHIMVPNSYEGYIETLIDAFPHEKEGIHKYFEAIKFARKKLQLFFGLNLLPKPITRFSRRTFAYKISDLALHTTEQVMSRWIKDDKLKAVLDAQWGNIGAPRQNCSFLIHAAMLGNFLEDGAAYPIGGSAVFAQELGRVIYDNGGAIRVKARVAGLLIKNNTACGVTLDTGETIQSKRVISSIGLHNTYLNLLKDQDSCAPAISELQQMQKAYEYINLFIGFKESPADFGLGKGNTWIHPNWDSVTDEPYWNVGDLDQNPDPRVMFFSSSSLRDPDLPNRKHNGYNGQIISAVNYGAFDQWKDSRWKHREDGYYDKKAQISDRLMTLLDEKNPGIKDNVDYMELGTTLSYEHFCASHKGIPYGLSSRTERYKSLLTRPTTPVKNLYVCGQDLVMPGVPAAVGSANLCCSIILRKNIGTYWTKRGRKL